MAVTRLERKGQKNVSRAKARVRTIKRLSASPVLKNVDVEAIKAGWKKKETKADKKAETKVDEAKEAPKAKEKKETAPKAEKKVPAKKKTPTKKPSATKD